MIVQILHNTDEIFLKLLHSVILSGIISSIIQVKICEIINMEV